MKFFKDLYYNYLCLNLQSYDKIGIDLEINKVLLFLFLGLCIATVVLSINQMNTALLLKKLLRLEIFSEDKSKKLSDLGLDKNLILKHLLSKNSSRLLSIITLVGYEKPTYEEYVSYEKAKRNTRFKPQAAKKALNEQKAPSLTPDFDVVSIYIKEENVDAAEELFKNNSTSVFKIVGSCIIIMASYVAIMLLMPSILSLVNNILA